MIRSTIIVQGYILDLLDDIATDFTYSIQDIRNPDKRTTDFSKTITIPGTPKNNALFAHLFNLNVENQYDPNQTNIAYNYNANKTAKAVVLVDGIQVFQGVIQILKITGTGHQIIYETSVLGRLSDILFSLGELKLSDINFTDLNHTLTIAHIQDVWNNPANFPYTYPLIDYGTAIADSKYPLDGFAPAIYVREYLNRIFAHAGFTYNCPFFNFPYFRNLIIPSTESDTFPGGAGSVKYLDCYTKARADQNNRTGKWREIANTWGPPKAIDKYGFITFSSDENIASRITFTRNIETSVQLTFVYTCSRDAYINVHYFDGVNDSILQSYDTGVYTIFPHTKIIEIEKRAWKVGDTLTLNIDMPPKTKIGYHAETRVIVPSPIDTSAYPVDEGASVVMKNFISKSVLQKDLLKSIILMHNLYIFTDPDNDKNLFIVPQNQFYNTYAGDSVDWTHKIDYSKEIEIVPMGELTAREFDFTYKADTDYWNDMKYFKVYNEVYGWKRFIVDNDFQKDTTKIEVIFSPTISVQSTTTRRVIPHIYKVDPNTKAKSRDAFNIRILQYGGMLPSYQNDGVSFAIWNIIDPTTGSTLLSSINYPYAGMLDNPVTPSRSLEFAPPRELFFTPPAAGYPDVGLFKYYWEGYMLEISNKDSKIWKVSVLLTPNDINRLDFKKLVKVDNIYFKLNKIDGYSPLSRDVTKVELFKTVVTVEVVKPGFILWSDAGYLLNADGSSRIPYI